MLNVFISHNCKDKPIARKIAKELNRYGIKVWIDEAEIKLGDSLIEKIREGLDRMDFLIALISENSVQSEWVKRELDIAMNNEIAGKKVISLPILVGKCELPGFLKGKLYADMSTTRKYNENILSLIRRFDINEIQEDKNEFTEYKLNAVEVIEKIENTHNEDELIEFLESFGYSERTLFYRDTFIQVINKLVCSAETSCNVVVSLIDVCRFCPEDALIKLNMTQLLDLKDVQILQSTIRVLSNKRSLKIQQKKILKILKDCEDLELEKCIWDFFILAQLDIDVAESLWEYINGALDNIDNYSNKMIMCMCKLYNQLNSDSIIEKWYALWSLSDEKRKRELITYFCRFGCQSEGLYISSPKLRNNVREVLFNSFTESDIENANLMVALLTCAGNIVENRKEIWSRLSLLDEYSILLTLETLRDEYNIAYIFDTIEDVEELTKISTLFEGRLKKVVIEIIAEINLKEALDFIKDETDFVMQYYNCSSILFTILKTSNVKEYEKLYNIVKRRVENGYLSQTDKNLIYFAEYCIGNIEVDDLIDRIQIKKEEGTVFDNIRKNRFIITKLSNINDDCYSGKNKKILELVREKDRIY